MKNILLFLFAVITITSCRTYESINSKTISDYNIVTSDYVFYTSEKLTFERKYAKPSRNKNVNLYIEKIKLNKKCQVIESNDNDMTVQFKKYTFKFIKDTKGDYKISENQEFGGEKYKLVKGNGSLLMCKTRTIHKKSK
ncbi:hypothetical protein M0Q50_08250 [bacterium]|jgi:hypothetical protein|nr:hypothetical protein [bacterium]